MTRSKLRFAQPIAATPDGSLRRLDTEYVDLFWLHVWDRLTPAEELLETMASLVRTGKIHYWGMSNAPAWYIAKVATRALIHGMPGPIALQYFYSLVNRDIEDEHVPLAAEFGMGVLPSSPQAYGLLTGKYDWAAVAAAGPLAGGLPNDSAAEGTRRPAVRSGWMASVRLEIHYSLTGIGKSSTRLVKLPMQPAKVRHVSHLPGWLGGRVLPPP